MNERNSFFSRRLARSVGWIAALGLTLAACKTTSTAPAPVAPEAPSTPVAADPDTEVAAEQPPARQYPQPPAAGEPKPVNFPEIERFQLANGLTVYLVENREIPIVSAQLVVRCGTMDDEYVAPFVAAMLGEGTKSRSKARIDETIEFVGGSIRASAGVHVSTIVSRVLAKDAGLALSLMADQAQSPTFPAEALAKLKEQSKAGLRTAKSNPGALAQALFGSVAYPQGHPYGRTFPTEEQIDAISVEDVKEFHGTFYKANNAFLILSGDINRTTVTPLVKRAFSKWAAVDVNSLPPNPLNKFKAYDLPSDLIIHIVDRPGSAQSEIVVGNLALARNHEDWLTLQVANSILGDSGSGRLFRDIREQRGLAYQIGSAVTDGQAPGTFSITTRTRTKTTGQMLVAIFEHIKRIRSEAPSEDEVTGIIRKKVGAFPLEIETPGQIANKIRESLVYGLPANYWRTYRDLLGATSAAQISEAARNYVHPIPHVVIVGKAKKIESQVREVFPKAEIKKYDTELSPL